MVIRFGHYILESQKRAGAYAFLLSLLPLFGLLSTLIVLLVTLRKGARDGFIVMLWSILPMLASLVVLQHFPNFPTDVQGTPITTITLTSIFLISALINWLLALVLRSRASWTSVFECFAIVSLLIFFCVLLMKPDILDFWSTTLLKPGIGDLTVAQYTPIMTSMSSAAFGVLFNLAFLGCLGNLILARWWQSLLFNPGGLRLEIYKTKCSHFIFLFMAIAAIITFLGMPVGWALLIVSMALPIFSGVMIIHNQLYLSRKWSRPGSWGLCFLFYLILIFSLPFSLLFLTVLGLLDCFCRFRTRYPCSERVKALQESEHRMNTDKYT